MMDACDIDDGRLVVIMIYDEQEQEGDDISVF